MRAISVLVRIYAYKNPYFRVLPELQSHNTFVKSIINQILYKNEMNGNAFDNRNRGIYPYHRNTLIN